ncbi:hypothetical protein BM1374165_01426 [Bartonella henselae]|uniref:Uncharacterized protein n=1 Tax=Bartonella henselae TaxID=38323 RepID=X5M5K9_BARHN|nr:hypothetical protein BM1374165_01305 [Bartonella henselae]CDO47408.1 hypothetical protein BM1374165_01426 [Bartonella henselae]
MVSDLSHFSHKVSNAIFYSIIYMDHSRVEAQ